MKRRFTLIITAIMLMMSGLAYGQTRTQINWTASEQGYTNGETIESVTFDANVSAAFNKGSNNNAPKYYNTGQAIRCYGGNYFTVTSTGGNLTEIALSFASGEGTNEITTDVGTYTSGTWTGSAASVTFTIGGTSGHRRISAFAITYSGGGQQTVATPTFSPEAGTYYEAQSVTISCTTSGATIYYTTDGTTPVVEATGINGSEYTSPIAINETTTVKAIAVKSGMTNSAVASALYTIEEAPTVITIAAAKALAVDQYAMVQGIVTFIDGRNVYAQDETAGICLYLNSTLSTLNLGDMVQAYGKRANYKGLYELTGINPSDATQFSVISTGNTLPLAEKTIAEINEDAAGSNLLQATRVNIVDAVLGTINTANNTPITQGQNTINIYKMPTLTGIVEGDNVDVIGIIGFYNNPQIRVASAADVTIHETPVVNYNVTVAEGITNGTVVADKATAAENDTIFVTATANMGYELSTLTYIYAGVSAPIDIMDAKQFLMPAADVTINGTFTELAHVATPTIAPVAGTYITAQEVSITCATEGATIYYTTDGTTPTANSEVYEEPFTVSTTTTVKAMAVKEEMNDSDVASVTYTIIEQSTIAAARALELNQYALVQGVVTFIDGRNVYVQDETAGIVLYLNNNTVPSNLALGDMVLGYGKRAAYNGLVELSGINGGNASQFLVVSSGNQLPVAEKTIAEINADAAGSNMLQSTRVKVVNATIGAINTSNNTPITQGENTMNIYKIPAVTGLEEGDFVTVTGVIGCYNAVQLRVALASDVTYTHPAGIFINPTSLSGFNYVYEEGPSTIKTFNISGRSLTAATHIYASENYEMSSFPGDTFYPESHITINTYTGVYNYTIKVRLKAGLEIGDYNEEITITQDEVGTMTVALSGSVTGEPPTPVGYTRISDLSQVTNGAKVIFASRFDENATSYYAMTATASGKPEGVLFTSVVGTEETLPAEITDVEDTFYWTVATDGENYTFTNAGGNVLGYTSGTNFATGGDNTAWTIEAGIADTAAMVPSYEGFVITNVNNTGRAFALNSYHNYGPYAKSNMTGSNASTYNFLIDIFATAGGTPVCAAPTFNPEAGTYYEVQEVAINCGTDDATIYYTLDGSDPTEDSEVYTEPIEVAETMTIKAIAMKEGYENSNIATAEYTIILGAVTIFNQDWEGEMNGWTFVTVEGSKPWTIGQYQGNHYAYGNGYNGGANEQWCISPAFSLNVYSNVSMTFRNAKNYTGPDMEVYFSNDYDGENPAEATWTELEYEKSTGSFAWAESGTIDLAGFAGDECYIGFKYTSTETEAAAWEVDDIVLVGFTSEPYLTVTPTSLTGFTHIIGQGPSASQTFVLTAGNIGPAPGGTTGSITMTVFSPFEISLDDEEYGDEIFFEDVTNLEATTIYVRMNGTEVGQYTETVNIYASTGDEATVTLSGTVTEEPTPGGDWNRIYALSDLNDGDQIILASRYDATVGNGYYAMTAGVSGKPEGVLFTSVDNAGVEQLPSEIADNADTYLWNVTVNDTIITLVNAAGDTLGYPSSGTNFAGNQNTDWAITVATSSATSLIPNYPGFVITNVAVPNRGVAKNSSNNFGAYAISNIGNTDYNFYLDIFVQGGVVTPTVATPVFSVASGTYYEVIEVEITCATEGATIYYTTDGTDPSEDSEIYEEPIVVDTDMTIKAIAMKEGYDDSGIATANYVIMTDVIVLLNQDWEGEMDGWTFVTIEGNKPWTIGSYSGNHYANANGYGDDVDNEQWCISPAINLNARVYQNVTLTFMNAMKFDGPALEVYFSNDYNGSDPGDATWEPLEYTPSPGSYTWTESGEISLDAFSGESCYIGFRYISTIDEGAAAWEVDDIMITAEIGSSVITAEATLNVAVWNSNNELMIANNSDESVNVVVYNLVGQPVLSQTVATGNNVIRHDLAEGIYIVRIANGKETTGIKVIVRR